MRIMKTVCILICLIAAVFSAEAVLAQETALDDITILNRLEIIQGYEDGELHPELNITRMEYVTIIVRCLGFEDLDLTSDGGAGFADVPADSWGAKYVKTAAELGIIEGYDDGRFGPEDNITIIDAAKILVSVLGYDLRAEEIGGYPAGYRQTAISLGILEGDSDFESMALRADVAGMIYNSLEIEFAAFRVSDTYITHFENERTLLHCMDITKLEDVVTAVYGWSTEDTTDTLKEDEIVISGEKYVTKLPVDMSYVGLNSYIYIKNYDEADEVVLLVLPRNRNHTVTVDAEDISSNTTLSSFEYFVDDEVRRISLPEDVSVVYNGSPLLTTSQLTPERIQPQCGSVTLVDSDGNGVYEALFVKDYTTYVIRNIGDDAIFDMYGNNFIFNPSEAQVTVIKADEIMTLEDLEVGDVISVAASLDMLKLEIVVSDSSVQGKVSLMNTENGYEYYTLDTNPDIAYKRTAAYINAIESGYSAAEDFGVGDDVIFHLNAFGEIAWAELSGDTDRYHYGYLYEAAYEDTLFDPTAVFQIVTANNEFEELPTVTDKTVKFGRMSGGSYITSQVDSAAILETVGIRDDTERQLVKYKLNTSGQITELYLLDSQQNTSNFSIEFSKKSLNFAYHIIDNQYYYDENTVVLHIPSSGIYPERISAGRPSDFFSNNSSYSVELYDVDDDGYVNLIVYAASVPRYNETYINYTNSPVMLVTDVITTIIDDDTYTMVKGYEDGNLVSRIVSDKVSPSAGGLRPGIVIQYATSSELAGYAMTSDETVGIILYNILMDCNDSGQEQFDYWNYGTVEAANAKIKVSYSQVTRFDYPFLRTNGYDNAVYEVSDAVECYRYDRSSDEVFVPINSTEVQEGDVVFVRTRYNYLKELIVIE